MSLLLCWTSNGLIAGKKVLTWMLLPGMCRMSWSVKTGLLVAPVNPTCRRNGVTQRGMGTLWCGSRWVLRHAECSKSSEVQPEDV